MVCWISPQPLIIILYQILGECQTKNLIIKKAALKDLSEPRVPYGKL